MPIQFTQFLRPDGRRVPVEVERPEEVEQLAKWFVDGGGWFEVEELQTGHASLTACAVVDDEPDDIAIRVVMNGPAVPNAVDDLVREAVQWLEKRTA